MCVTDHTFTRAARATAWPTFGSGGDVEDVGSRLWALEREFWLGGADVYCRHLADESLMVFPGMVLTKAQTVESIAAGPRWTRGYTAVDQVNRKDLQRWLAKARDIQWDYKNLIRRKGRLERLSGA